MARRIPLPRLTQRQRLARWQRERRQQAVILTVFSAILFFSLGLAAWAATDRYYRDNLKPAAVMDGQSIPLRDWKHEMNFELVLFYDETGVPIGSENDPTIADQKTQFDGRALDALVEQSILDSAAKAVGVTVDQQTIDQRYTGDYTQNHLRHILISPKGTDEAANLVAQAKARAVADQLRQDPTNDDLWKSLAAAYSDDPGTKDAGGDLGFGHKGEFVPEFETAAAALAVGQVSEPVKTTFGYHIIQVTERRTPEQTELFQRWAAAGFGIADVKSHTRYDLLKDTLTKRAQDQGAQSPTLQFHLAWIAVATPSVSAADTAAFTNQIKKVSDIQSELNKGTDFAEVAKTYSEDPTNEKGGDLGWYAKGMLPKIDVESELFALADGKTSRQFSDKSQTVWYKVLERDPQRTLEDDQKTKIKDNAYPRWIQEQKKAHGMQKLVPGHQLDG